MGSTHDVESSLPLEGGGNLKGSSKEIRHGRTAHNMSSSSLRKKSELVMVSKLKWCLLRQVVANLQEVLLGTKLALLFPAVPLAFAAHLYNFGRPWIFALSLLGLTPLAERLSFLTEQIAFYTGPTGSLVMLNYNPRYLPKLKIPSQAKLEVGGLLNATCGNATEIIIAVLALYKGKIEVLKCSLVGSVLSNLLLVLGSSLFCGGLANLGKEQKYDRKQSDVNCTLLLLGLLCQLLPLALKYSTSDNVGLVKHTLYLSRVSSIVMLVAYIAYIIFQLKTHRWLFEALHEEDGDNDVVSEEGPVIGFPSAFVWLVGMTSLIAILSEYIVGTIEAASESWGLSVSFISIILLPIVGNAAEHAGAVIFGFKNKLDISLGVALGSATQISVFVVPLSIIVAWIMGIHMDLGFNLLEIGSLFISILLTAFTLQDGTSHYLKGLVLLLSYIVIGTCFFVFRTSSPTDSNVVNVNIESLPTAITVA